MDNVININDLVIELEVIRNQLFDFPLNSNNKTYKELILELTNTIERLKIFKKEDEIIPKVLSEEDLPDDEDL